ncbi:MAG: helix-turn-helix domain-containing protein [Elusimicrobiaceae bacterium]|nr:helix-turn-helix domain-containing protein [Elusimicrobiaceae bacterium]
MDKLDRNRDTPLYNIGTAARLCGLEIYTLRWLEKNGLLAPGRTPGNRRLFSDADIEILAEIAALLNRNVNIQGIKVVLEIKRMHHITIRTTTQQTGG